MEAGVGLVEISYFESAGSSPRRESFWYSIEVDCSSLNENDGRRSASGTHLLDKWARAPTYNSLSHAILNLTYRSGQEWSEDIRSRAECLETRLDSFPSCQPKTPKNPSSLPADSSPLSFAFASDPKIVGGKMMEIPLKKRLIPLLEIETIYECNKVQFLCNSKGIFFFHAIHEIGCCCRVIGRSSGTSVIIGIHSASEVEKNVDLLITERHERPQSVNYIAVRMVNRAHVRAHWPKPTKIFVAV